MSTLQGHQIERLQAAGAAVGALIDAATAFVTLSESGEFGRAVDGDPTAIETVAVAFDDLAAAADEARSARDELAAAFATAAA